MAPVAPDAVASLIKNQLGHIARIAGEVLYIMKCLPIMVEIRREENCYLELPVTAYNRSVFMSPSTRILQEHAQQIECNTIMPAMYYLEDKWIGFDPYPTIGITPQELKVDSEEPFVFKTIQSLGTGGIYTATEIERAQNDMMFNFERSALNNIIIRKMAGKPVNAQGYSTLSLFDKYEMEELANSTIKALYGYFTILGEFTSGLLGLYFIFRAVKFVFETSINAISLHKINGCSFHLLASFWNTLTLFILHQKHYKKKNTNKPEGDKEAETYWKNEEPTFEAEPSSETQKKHSLRYKYDRTNAAAKGRTNILSGTKTA
jgi:hypothetical protein